MSPPPRQAPSGRSPWARRIGASLASLALVLLVAEGATRLFTRTDPVLFLSDPAVGVRHLPSFEGRVYDHEARRRVPVRFHRDGFRGPDRPYTKPAGVRRVAVLGDSMVAALQVDEELTAVSRLEELLEASHPEVDWEVFNFGVASSSVGMGWPLYREVVARYQPDLVLGCYFPGNDFGDVSRRIRQNAQIYYDLDPDGGLVQVAAAEPRSALSRWLNRNSRFYVWQKRALTRVGRSVRGSAAAAVHLEKWIHCTRHTEVLDHAWRLSAALIGATRDAVEADGGTYALIMIPAVEQVYPAVFERMRAGAGSAAADFDWDHAADELAAICAPLGVPFVSLAPDFRERATAPVPEDESEQLFIDGYGHLTARGNEVVADALHRFLTVERQAGASPLVDRILGR